jgi:hypothetical protein
MSGFVCVYFGQPDECPECGGFNRTGDRYCSHECGDQAAMRAADHEEQIQARRAREDAFAAECERLRAAGHTDEEIDVLLVGMPT